MKIASVEFVLRRNLGNYEHSEIKLAAVIDEKDDHEKAIAVLKLAAEKALYGKTETATSTVSESAAETPVPGKEKPYENVTSMKDGVTKAEADKQEKEQKAKAAAQAKAEKEAAKAAADAEKASKAAAKTVEKYDPAIKEHTDTVAAQLNKLFGEAWKADKAHAKKVSRETLVGFDFRNKESGEILPSFLEELKKHFGDLESAL
jgi:hypothetical protein